MRGAFGKAVLAGIILITAATGMFITGVCAPAPARAAGCLGSRCAGLAPYGQRCAAAQTAKTYPSGTGGFGDRHPSIAAGPVRLWRPGGSGREGRGDRGAFSSGGNQLVLGLSGFPPGIDMQQHDASCSQIAHEITTRQDELKLRRDPHYCDRRDITCRKENSLRISQLEREIGYLGEMESDCEFLQGHWVFYDGVTPYRDLNIDPANVTYDLCGTVESGICVAQWTTSSAGIATDPYKGSRYEVYESLSANKNTMTISASNFQGGYYTRYAGELQGNNPYAYLGDSPVFAGGAPWRLYKKLVLDGR